MPIKLIDIARLAGVSKSTASRALGGSPFIKEETKRRILEIAEEHKYTPNSMARAMVMKRTGVVAFLIYRKNRPRIAHTFFGPILDAAIDEAAKSDYHIILAATDEPTATFEEHFIQDSIDGAMLVSMYPDDVIREFKRRDTPIVVINKSPSLQRATYILSDNYGGACAAMEHLIVDRGHTKIAMISAEADHDSFSARCQAYVDMLAWHGIPSTFRISGGTNSSFASGAMHMKELLAGGVIPTAVFAVTDTLALGAMRAIKDAGLRVPQDIAVIGFDDIEAAGMSDPPLSTIWVDREDIGRQAARSLIEQIEHPELPARVIFTRTSLVIRGST
jgi:DNA-binding LacI/PurR family transcriptional regulator